MTILYFAYGSNMLSGRITKRVSSAKAIGRAVLYDWCVAFNKKVPMIQERQIHFKKLVLLFGMFI